MKIFVTADLHGRHSRIENLKAAAKEADLILIGGDVGGYPSPRTDTPSGMSAIEYKLSQYRSIQKQDASYLESVLDTIPIPAYYILGNDDWFEISSKRHLTSTLQIGDMTIIPFEWVQSTPFNTNREVNENKLMYELIKLGDIPKKSIILAHTPPKGIGDRLPNNSHVGSVSVRNWIACHQPAVWLCGHIHESFGSSHIGRTLVANCTTGYFDKSALRGYIIDTNTMLATERIYRNLDREEGDH